MTSSLWAGTIAYTAPEQLTLRRPRYNEACDVYSLGIVLWELATGDIPYEGLEADVIRGCVRAGERLDLPDDVPEHFSHWIQQCTAQKPLDRPTCAQLMAKMRLHLHTGGEDTGPSKAPVKPTAVPRAVELALLPPPEMSSLSSPAATALFATSSDAVVQRLRTQTLEMDELVAVTRRWVSSLDVQTQGTSLMLSLPPASYSALIEAGGVEALVWALEAHPGEAALQAKVFHLLCVLAATQASSVVTPTLPSCIVRALVSHSSLEVQLPALRLLTQLAKCGRPVWKEMVARDGVDAVVRCMELHPDSTPLQVEGCRVLDGVVRSSHDVATEGAVNVARMFERLLGLLPLDDGGGEVAAAAWGVLRSVVDRWSSARQWLLLLRDAGGVQLLQSLRAHHPDLFDRPPGFERLLQRMLTQPEDMDEMALTIVEEAPQGGDVGSIELQPGWSPTASTMTGSTSTSVTTSSTSSTLSPPSPPSSPPRVVQLGSEAGDGRGVGHYLGTRYGQSGWQNPADLGLVRVLSSGHSDEASTAPLHSVVGREGVGYVCSVNRPLEWLVVDFTPSNLLIRPSAYSLRFDPTAHPPHPYPLSWRLDASVNLVEWFTLSLLVSESTHLSTTSHTWPLSLQPSMAFTAFRLLQTGPNSAGDHRLAISALEVYGAVEPSPPRPMPAPPTVWETFPTGLVFDYTADWDECGVLHWLGSGQGRKPWVNPCDVGLVRCTSVPLTSAPRSPPASALVGREAVHCLTTLVREVWLCVELMAVYVRPSAYSLRLPEPGQGVEEWRLQASNDGVHWTELLCHRRREGVEKGKTGRGWQLRGRGAKSEEAPAGEAMEANGKSGVSTWRIPPTHERYRMFRVMQTQTESSGRGGRREVVSMPTSLELYGAVFDAPLL